MLRVRVIPVLLLHNGSLVKTIQFGRFSYIGDPANTLRIFNECEVDELVLLDILASRKGLAPDLQLLADVADECFMPLTYGGGVRDLDDVRKVLEVGSEKVVVNTSAVRNPSFISQAAKEFGSQCIIGSIDYRYDRLHRPRIYTNDGLDEVHESDPVVWARKLQELGVGEILLTCIDREGTWSGYDLEVLGKVAEAVELPVIAHGGAGRLQDIGAAVRAGASAAALGSMVVYQKQGMGVLVNFPEPAELEQELAPA